MKPGLLLVIALLGCSAPGQETARPASGRGAVDAETARMVERLRAIHQTPFLLHHPFRNREKAEWLEKLEVPSIPGERRRHLMRLGSELLWAGRTEEAIATFERLSEEFGGDGSEEATRILRWLGIAFLRLGEQQNCIDRHGSASCLLPIAGGGIHLRQEPSRRAMALFREVLRNDPEDVTVRFLLNVAAMTVGEYPDGVDAIWRIDPGRFESEEPFPRFTDTATQRGLATVGLAGGVVVEDLDGDDDLDVMTSSWGHEDPLSLLLNRGDGTFEDASGEAELTGLDGGLNLVPADYDNDGDVDILVLRGAWLGALGNYPNSLLENDGKAHFADVTESAGLLSFFPSQSAAWGDYDNDGHLDLFVAAEASANPSLASCLYRNLGNGTFEDVSKREGAAVSGFAKGAVWGDYDNDGWIDLYVSRLDGPNVLLHNGGPAADPRFVDRARGAGVEEPLTGFPTWFFDFDNDGWLDIFAASFPQDYETAASDGVIRELLGEPPTVSLPRLYRNLGTGAFEDVTEPLGLRRSLLAMGANFGDIDNDGWLDIYIGTGAPSLAALMPNRMFRNVGGRRFVDVTSAGGFGHLQKGHGISFADLDGDGDQDVLAVMGGAFSGDLYANALFENPGNANSWLTLRLRGRQANRSAIGARVRLVAAAGTARREIYRTVSTGGSFGANSLQLEIGLGDATAVELLEVSWPGAAEPQVFHDLQVDQVLEIVEGEPVPVRVGG
jgi:FG-GAP-like repeat/ASPIC and UnbV